MSYIEVEIPPSKYWLKTNNHYVLYHDGFNPMIETSFDDKIQNNEAMFFVRLYHENPNLSISWEQRQREIKDDVFRVKIKERYCQKIDYLEEQKTNISSQFYDLCKNTYILCLIYLSL